MLRHELFIPPASALNDLRDARPRLHRPPLHEWVAFMKSLSEKGLAPTPPEEHARRIDEVAASLGIDMMLDIATTMLHDLMTKFFIYSMSKRWDNLSMWEWYGSKHTGYCLEFLRSGIFGGAREVVYDTSLVMDFTDPAHRSANWFYYKSPDWSNEEEIRTVLPRRLGGPVFRLDPRLLSRVILGKDMSAHDVERVRQWSAARVPPACVVSTRWDPFDLRLVIV